MMMAHARGPGAGREAASFRFLGFFLGGWVLLRIGMVWNPAMPAPPEAIGVPWAIPAGRMVPAPWESRAATMARIVKATPVRPGAYVRRIRVDGKSVGNAPSARMPANGGFVSDRHTLRIALMAHLLPAAGSALAKDAPMWMAAPPRAPSEPGQGRPFWIRQSLAKWSLSGWLYLREGSGNAPEGIAAGGQLGGSQAGLRLAYGFGDNGRLRAYGRATMAVHTPEQRELAFGAAFAPFSRLPVDVAVERRVAIGREGRNALAAMVAGGVGDVVLPAGFRLEAYGQAGIVGARRRDGFDDGALIVDRRLGADERAPLRLGALAAGAIQPGASRVDVGPRLTLRLPDIGKGSRIALDWRQRVAGDARPESGVAFTLASDF